MERQITIAIERQGGATPHISIPIKAWRRRSHSEITKEKTQNILAACTFDLQFSCVFPGWEGSAHDTRVLQDALDKNAFSIPPGKFYLADAGYTCRWPF